MEVWNRKQQFLLLALLSMICLSNAQSTCEDCCKIYNALMGPFIVGLSWSILLVGVCVYIVVKQLPGGDYMDTKIVGAVNVALSITVAIWYTVMRVDVDCECCEDDKTAVIVLLSIECVGMAQAIFVNSYLSYKYQYWRYLCCCAKPTETTNQKEREHAAV